MGICTQELANAIIRARRLRYKLPVGLQLPSDCGDRAISRDARAAGIITRPLSGYCMQAASTKRELRFAARTIDSIDKIALNDRHPNPTLDRIINYM
ncbi:MAG: hypothetical protein ACOH2B_05120 [Burkholderiaceae bacterium]